MKALSFRAKELLLVVDERTEYDIAGNLAKYFVPSSRPYYTPISHKSGFYVSGSGDARILKSLEAKGMIERPRTAPDSFKYSYKVTESGRIAAEEIRSKIPF